MKYGSARFSVPHCETASRHAVGGPKCAATRLPGCACRRNGNLTICVAHCWHTTSKWSAFVLHHPKWMAALREVGDKRVGKCSGNVPASADDAYRAGRSVGDRGGHRAETCAPAIVAVVASDDDQVRTRR